MTDEKRGRVAAALKAVLNELDVELEWVNEEGAQAFEPGVYQRVEEAVQRSRQIRGFRQKVASLEIEWQTVRESLGKPSGETPPLPRGQRRLPPQGPGTPTDAFRLPILQALMEMGGKAPRVQVFARIHEMMNDQMKAHDIACVPSGSVRWHGKAQSARQAMVREGLIRDDSPHGVWEITEAGRQALAKARSDQ